MHIERVMVVPLCERQAAEVSGSPRAGVSACAVSDMKKQYWKSRGTHIHITTTVGCTIIRGTHA